jgi:uncharacterized phage-associated protein
MIAAGKEPAKPKEKSMSRLIAVANEFIHRALAQGVADLSPFKLHDLVYLAQGWRIGSANQMLFESPAMAHHDGVFLKELREQGCWGTKNLTGPIEIFSQGSDGMLRQSVPLIIPSDPAMVTLDYVWEQYGKLSPYETTGATREGGGPWDQVWNATDRDTDEAREIPLEVVRRWFSAQFKLRAVAGVAKLRRVRSADEHDEATELHLHPTADHLRSA